MLIVQATLRDHNPGSTINWAGATKSGELHFQFTVDTVSGKMVQQYAIMVTCNAGQWAELEREVKDFAGHQNLSTAKLLLAGCRTIINNAPWSFEADRIKPLIEQFLSSNGASAFPVAGQQPEIQMTFNGTPVDVANRYVWASRLAGWSPQSRLAEPRPTLSAWAIMQLVLSLAPSMLVDPSAGTIHEINDLYFAIRQWLRDHPEVDANPHTPTTDELTGIKAKLAASLSKGADA